MVQVGQAFRTLQVIHTIYIYVGHMLSKVLNITEEQHHIHHGHIRTPGMS